MHSPLSKQNAAWPPAGVPFGAPPRQEAEDWYRLLLKHSQDLVCTHDLQGRLLSATSAAATLLGYSVEELLQIPMPDLIDPSFRNELAAYLAEIQRVGEAHGLLAVMTRSGERRIWEYHNTLQTEGVETPIVLGIARDVTEQKRAERMLSASEQRFRAIYDKSSIGISLVDPRDGRILQVNRKYCEITGRSEEELKSLDVRSITHPDDVATSVQRLRELAQGRTEPFEVEKRYVRPDGSVRWANLLVVPMWAEGKPPTCVMGLLQDITDRKQAEEALRQSEARYRSLFEKSIAGVAISTLEGELVDCNDTWARKLGYGSAEEVRGQRTVQNYAEPGQRQVFVDKLKREGTLFNQEMQLRRKDGTLLWALTNATLLPAGRHGPLMQTTFTDITERKLAEETLQETKEQFQLFIEHAPAALAMLDREMRYPCVSRRYLTEYGRGASDLRGVSHYEIFPAIPERWKESHRRGLAGEVVREENDGFEHPDGRVLRIRWEVRPWYATAGEVGGIVIFSEDITARKQAEDALRESEQKYQEVFDNVSDAIRLFDVTPAGRFQLVDLNAAAEKLWRVAAADVLEKFLEELIPPEVSAYALPQFRRCVESRQPVRYEEDCRKFDPPIYVYTTLLPVSRGDAPVGRVIKVDQDITELREVSGQLRAAKEKLAEEKLYLEEEIDTELGFEEIIGRSKALKGVLEQVARVASSDSTALLLGETGTGKELVARAIHRQSSRIGKPFIKMNCAAIPTGLLESELFGYEKGAFTGALDKKVGRVELADKGTLFLDEIGEIPLALQPKLLRVLQDHEFERLGGTRTLKSDFRLIAATNRDLLRSVSEGHFRRDLYYRLNVFPIRVPSLRERREDIRVLVEYFVQKFARRMNKSITSIPKTTMDRLTQWDWPGNVRELENFIERSVILTNGSVLVCPLGELRSDEEISVHDTLEAVERRHILSALRESRGQLSGPSGAAARLGLKRSTLQSKLKQLGIDHRSYRDQERTA